jgi:DNA-binding XRE family transcriptional regulator
MSKVQYIPQDGEPLYAVVPIEDYRILIAVAAGDEDDRDIREIIADIDAGEETFPDDFVGRLIETESPLREWRKYRGMTQAELAFSSGLSQGAIAQIESGKRNPTVETARKFANSLNCDIDDLF